VSSEDANGHRASSVWLDPELDAELSAIAWGDRPQATIDLDDLAPSRRRIAEGPVGPDAYPMRSSTILVARPDGDLALRLHVPDTGSGPWPVLVWLHGGGYVLGSAATDSRTERGYGASGNCVVVGVDYRVAPEHPHPAAVDDCLLALDWIVDHADAFRLDLARVVVGGESAGAGLAAAVALESRRHSTLVSFLFLLAPMLDDQPVSRRTSDVDSLGLWSSALNARAWAMYAKDRGDGIRVPYASVARAPEVDTMPSTYIDVGSADLFYQESMAFAARLAASGVATEAHVWLGAFHGFYEIAPAAGITLRATEVRVQALRRALGTSAVSDGFSK
jgi:acetyl esterase/lipase